MADRSNVDADPSIRITNETTSINLFTFVGFFGHPAHGIIQLRNPSSTKGKYGEIGAPLTIAVRPVPATAARRRAGS
ncbi:hypothetical protein O4H66_17900 [Comamonadaceae bacterium G21597-S1]|nr:hypothetical protein [Comamonadaceae bacterium G21597-S1]